MAGGSAILAIKIVADAKDAVTGLTQTGEGIDGLDKQSKGLMGSMGGAGLAVAGLAVGATAAVAVISELTQAAAEDRAEQDKLIAVYNSSGAAVGDYTVAIDAAIAAGAEKAFTDSEVRAGLQSLIVATGDAAEANALLGPAMDLARFAGVSLEQASDALAKAHSGQDGALRKLIPGLEKGKTATDTIANATKLAAGQADVYAASAEGMQKKGSDAFGELGETIGSAFLPIMDALVPAILPVIEILAELIKELLPLLEARDHDCGRGHQDLHQRPADRPRLPGRRDRHGQERHRLDRPDGQHRPGRGEGRPGRDRRRQPVQRRATRPGTRARGGRAPRCPGRRRGLRPQRRHDRQRQRAVGRPPGGRARAPALGRGQRRLGAARAGDEPSDGLVTTLEADPVARPRVRGVDVQIWLDLRDLHVVAPGRRSGPTCRARSRPSSGPGARREPLGRSPSARAARSGSACTTRCASTTPATPTRPTSGCCSRA